MHLTNCPEPRLDHRRINLPTQEVNVLSGNVGTDWWRGAVSTCPTYFGKQSNYLYVVSKFRGSNGDLRPSLILLDHALFGVLGRPQKPGDRIFAIFVTVKHMVCHEALLS